MYCTISERENTKETQKFVIVTIGPVLKTEIYLSFVN